MLFLLQAAAAHLPNSAPVYVTVQQPSGGMPEWVRILISAGVGALFGILSSLVGEYVKPAIAKHQLKKTVSTQLGAELMENLSAIESARRVLTGEDFDRMEPKARADFALRIALTIKGDRFDYYFIQQKALVYQIDEDRSLAGFYLGFKEVLPAIEENRQGPSLSGDLRIFLNAGIHFGHKYVATHRLAYRPTENMLEQMLRDTQEASTIRADQAGA